MFDIREEIVVKATVNKHTDKTSVDLFSCVAIPPFQTANFQVS